MKKTRQRFYAWALALCMMTSLLSMPVYATRGNSGTNTDGEWETGKTKNLIQLIAGQSLTSQGWELSTDQIRDEARNYNHSDVNLDASYGVVIQATTSDKDIGNKDYTGGACYTITLSEADRVRAQKGDLAVSAQARYWFQRSSEHYISLRLYFYNASGGEIEHKDVTFHRYYVGQHDHDLTLDHYSVPTETVSIKMWVSNWGSLAGRPAIGNIQCYLHDSTAPAFSSAALDAANITDSENGICIAGDTLAYDIKFNEAVQISASGSAVLAIDGTDFVTSSETAVSDDTVTYTFKLPEHNQSGTISLKSVSGLVVTDDAGNACTYTGTPDAGTVQYYKTMSVTNTLTNITSSNTVTTAKYGTDYDTTFTVKTGYSLPAAISVTAGGFPLVANQDYSYNSVDGYLSIFGTAIDGDIVITASAVPNQYAVILDGNGATTDGTPSVTAIFGEDMPAASMPKKTGYTFLGYFTEDGTQYYNADGGSAKAYDIPDAATLYAHWSANQYTITYHKNKPDSATHDVAGTMADSQFVYDQQAALRQNTYTLEGWTFKGWSNSAGGTVLYTDGQTVSNLIDKGNLPLYAVWEALESSVTLNAMGGSGSTIITATYDAPMPGTTMPSRPGYIFLGYFDQQEGGTQYYDADGASAKTWDKTEDTELYAQWRPIRYNIHFYSMGEYISAQTDVVYGKIHLPSAETLGISREHYNFVGWNIYDEQNWGMYMADTDYNVGLATKDGETVYLYAAWLEKDKFQITYDANGGSGAPSPVVVHQDETTVLSGQIPVRANYTFLGWATASDAEMPEYQPSDMFTMGNSLVTLYAVWQKNPMLSYDANGGAFSYYVPETYPPANSAVTVSEAVPEREGYDFLGWSLDKDAAEAEFQPGGSLTMPESDTVLYAVWERISYQITQTAAAGYTVNGLHDTYYYDDTATFTVTGEVAPKVYINGVETMDDDGYYSFTVTSKTDVVVVDSTAFNVVYHGNGGTDVPVDIFGYDEGDMATIKDGTPARTGYTFLGWADTASADAPLYHAGDKISITADTDTILYAIWAQNTYTIRFDGNGESGGGMADVNAEYDTAITLAENTFAKRGYRFLGWTTDTSYGVMYADKSQVKNLTAEDKQTVTLYAVWETATTTIVFNASGGAGGSTTTSVYYDSYLSDQNLRMPERYGYQFGGYYTQEDGHGEILFDENMKVSGRYASALWDDESANLMVYAYWIPVSYHIVYINGSEQLDVVQTARYGVSFNLYTAKELGIMAPEGYHLAGWSIASGSSTVYYTDGQTITTGLTGTDGDTVYLYAVIEENGSYTLYYDANGGSGAPPSQAKKLESGEDSVTMQISPAIPKKEGYTFAGWNTQSDGGGTGYAAGNEIQISADTTLYAVWTKLGEYTVTYHENTNDAVYGMPAPQSKTENIPLTLSKTIPLRTGYRFLGWAQSSDGEVIYKAGTENSYTENKSLDLYAVWEGEGFTVTFPVSGEGYTVSEPGVQKPVGYGGEVSFTITIQEGYTAERMVVSANGMSLGFSEVSGNVYSYVLKNVTSDIAVTVHDVAPIKFTVILTDGTGYTVTPQSQTVNYGQDVQFTVTLTEGYQTATPRVYVNGQPLTGVQGGDSYIYTITQVREQPVISISVIEKARYDIVFVNGENIFTIVNVEDGQLLTEPEPPEKEGYRFCGWYTDKKTTIPYDFSMPVTGAFVLYAKWEANTYTVNYEANTVDIVTLMPELQQKQHGVPLVLSGNIPQREGYTFAGWNTAADGTGTWYFASGEFITDDNATLYAQWNPAVYTVTFMADNMVYRVVQAGHNTLLDKITPPSKDGYDFDGWYHDGQRWDFATDKVTGNLTLHAVFLGETFIITPPVSGEGFTFASQGNETVAFGGRYEFTVTIADHYNGEHIRVLANGIVLQPVISDNVYHYTIENISSDCVIFIDGVEKSIYTVNFMTDGEIYRSVDVVYRSKLYRPVPPVKEGYMLKGWFDGETEWDFDNDTVSGDMTLNAEWERNRYSVTLPMNTDEYTITTSDELQVVHGEDFTFTVTVADGFDAAGMVVLANGVQLIEQSAVDNAFTYTITGITEAQTVTIRGIGQNTYSIVYKPGTVAYVGGLPDGSIKQHGVPAEISDAVPVRTGYQFLGWSLLENGETADYYAGDFYETDADLTIYAVWEPEKYQVIYEENGGTEIPDAQYVFGEGLVLPADEVMARPGFEFAGWYDNEQLEGAAVTEITTADMGNKTFYARWDTAAITPQGYEGIYDGKTHAVTFGLAEPVEVEQFQWYFKAENGDMFVPVDGEAYNCYVVQNVLDSGIYYCTLEVLKNGYVLRFQTNECIVKIAPKPITITAASGSKAYDKTPLTAGEFTQEGLIDTHSIEVLMTSDSAITNAGSCDNKIGSVVVKDISGNDVTENYEMTTVPGTLTVNPAPLTVEGKNISISKGRDISVHSLYTVSGMLGDESLEANVQIEAIEDSDGNAVQSLENVSGKTGTYTVVLSYNNFSGSGSENYAGSGSITATVTVRNSGGGSSSGGGGGSGFVTTTSYTVTFDTQGGSEIESIKVNKNSAVDEPETPARDGYLFDGWFMDEACTEPYDFDTKVTQNMTLYAKWTEEQKEPNEPADPIGPVDSENWDNPFIDVSDDDWFYDEVKNAVENGWFNGTAATTFSPNEAITRAMIVTVLWRAENKPAVNYRMTFGDVDESAYYGEAVQWAASEQIIKGYSAETFAPNKPISREEIAAIINRYADYKGMETNESSDLTQFADSGQIADWARENVSWTVGAGILSGKGSGILDPQGSTTRAEAVVMLQRLMEK